MIYAIYIYIYIFVVERNKNTTWCPVCYRAIDRCVERNDVSNDYDVLARV